jgi:hypothetical protein
MFVLSFTLQVSNRNTQTIIKRCHFLKKMVIMSILNDKFSISTIDCSPIGGDLFNPSLLIESKDFLNFSKTLGDGLSRGFVYLENHGIPEEIVSKK